ncbi:hypothetical protein QUB80_02325 [Chlorogloeopsis sp. ULAP01]|uniref:hypothetical protein n=1 Tax=Chlorogloeopsis sp. ULAP01 TaxID=3056483 RepID=UPI0025AAEFE3|nr:hypothetical protein [Chlorogloeopsis sp. ULAP01]MDM9379537.1 hypothetical protein [Chlorogloeopsis sp. ULAP01]
MRSSSSSSSSRSWAAIADSIPSLLRILRSSVAVSPVWEPWASSTMTAKRLSLVVMSMVLPFFAKVSMALVMKGNF